MMRRLALLVAAAALLAGCAGSGGGGGGSSTAGDAAKLVPADALAFVAIDTDFSSSQLKSATDIVDKFPIKAKALQELGKAASQNGVDLTSLQSSVGPFVDFAALTVGGKPVPVGFAKPDDEAAFEQQLKAHSTTPPLFAQVSGYTVIADSQAAIDAVKNSTGSLADVQSYKDAMASVPGDAVATAYVAPAALAKAKSAAPGGASMPLDTSKVQWVAGALTADGGAFKLEVHAKGALTSATQTKSTLVDQIPSGSLVALSIVGAGRYADVGASALKQAQTSLGFDFQGLLAALGDEAVAYVKPGIPLPEVTVATKSSDAERGESAVNALVAKLAKSPGTPVTAGGITLQSYKVGPVTIYVGRTGDEIVVSDNEGAIGELTGSGAKLVDDSVYKDAWSGAGAPDETEGFLFVDVKDALPAAEAIAQLAGQKVPAELDANLKPLQTLLVYGSRDGDVQTFVAYLSTS